MTEERQKKVKGFCCQVAKRVIEFGERSGRLPRGTSQRVRPVATAKPVVIADEEKKSRTFAAEFAVGVADPFEYIRSKGLDPKTVMANQAAFRKQMAAMGVTAAPAAPGTDVPAPAPPKGPTPAPPGSAGGDGSDSTADATKNIFGSKEATSESLAKRALVRWLTERGFTGVDPNGHHWQNGKQVAKSDEPGGGKRTGTSAGQGGNGRRYEGEGRGRIERHATRTLSDAEKKGKGVSDGIDKDVAAACRGENQRPTVRRVIAKAKDLAFTAIAHAQLFINRIAVTHGAFAAASVRFR